METMQVGIECGRVNTSGGDREELKPLGKSWVKLPLPGVWLLICAFYKAVSNWKKYEESCWDDAEKG